VGDHAGLLSRSLPDPSRAVMARMQELFTLATNLLGLDGVASLVHVGRIDVASLTGVQALLAVVFPVLLIAEICFLAYTHRAAPGTLSRALKLPLLAYATHAVLATFLSISVFLWTQTTAAKFALIDIPMNLIGFVYAYVVWELGHFVHHWSCHRVRLFWCLHAPHHAPTHINLSVVHAHFLYQGVHATFIRTAICTVLGVPIAMLLFVMAIDGCWGSLIHASEEAWPSGRLPGMLGRVFLSPAHHRVHHASNPEYIDKNFCNTLPLWDKLFGTFQDEIPTVALKYGVKRSLKPGSFVDFYFGEFLLLLRDVADARSFKEAGLYLVMPPDWRPYVTVDRDDGQVQTNT
jgi:sterol desaturase/sphingolipid hydroxylase (fatty acid hydroxylase superfamily)